MTSINSLFRRLDKLGRTSGYIYDGRCTTIYDDGTEETAKRIDELLAEAEAEGRGVIVTWLVGDDGQRERRFKAETTGDRKL